MSFLERSEIKLVNNSVETESKVVLRSVKNLEKLPEKADDYSCTYKLPFNDYLVLLREHRISPLTFLNILIESKIESSYKVISNKLLAFKLKSEDKPQDLLNIIGSVYGSETMDSIYSMNLDYNRALDDWNVLNKNIEFDYFHMNELTFKGAKLTIRNIDDIFLLHSIFCYLDTQLYLLIFVNGSDLPNNIVVGSAAPKNRIILTIITNTLFLLSYTDTFNNKDHYPYNDIYSKSSRISKSFRYDNELLMYINAKKIIKYNEQFQKDKLKCTISMSNTDMIPNLRLEGRDGVLNIIFSVFERDTALIEQYNNILSSFASVSKILSSKRQKSDFKFAKKCSGSTFYPLIIKQHKMHNSIPIHALKVDQKFQTQQYVNHISKNRLNEYRHSPYISVICMYYIMQFCLETGLCSFCCTRVSQKYKILYPVIVSKGEFVFCLRFVCQKCLNSKTNCQMYFRSSTKTHFPFFTGTYDELKEFYRIISNNFTHFYSSEDIFKVLNKQYEQCMVAKSFSNNSSNFMFHNESEALLFGCKSTEAIVPVLQSDFITYLNNNNTSVFVSNHNLNQQTEEMDNIAKEKDISDTTLDSISKNVEKCDIYYYAIYPFVKNKWVTQYNSIAEVIIDEDIVDTFHDEKNKTIIILSRHFGDKYTNNYVRVVKEGFVNAYAVYPSVIIEKSFVISTEYANQHLYVLIEKLNTKEILEINLKNNNIKTIKSGQINSMFIGPNSTVYYALSNNKSHMLCWNNENVKINQCINNCFIGNNNNIFIFSPKDEFMVTLDERSIRSFQFEKINFERDHSRRKHYVTNNHILSFDKNMNFEVYQYGKSVGPHDMVFHQNKCRFIVEGIDTLDDLAIYLTQMFPSKVLIDSGENAFLIDMHMNPKRLSENVATLPSTYNIYYTFAYNNCYLHHIEEVLLMLPRKFTYVINGWIEYKSNIPVAVAVNKLYGTNFDSPLSDGMWMSISIQKNKAIINIITSNENRFIGQQQCLSHYCDNVYILTGSPTLIAHNMRREYSNVLIIDAENSLERLVATFVNTEVTNYSNLSMKCELKSYQSQKTLNKKDVLIKLKKTVASYMMLIEFDKSSFATLISHIID